jgi:LuxR family maltose regulon positive regulatory protein
MPDQAMSKTLRRQLESELLLMWGYLHYWSGDGAESLAKINQLLKFVPAGHTFILAHAIEHKILAIQMTGGYQEALELAASASEMRLAYRPFYRARIHLSEMVTHLCEGNLQHADLAARRLKSIAQENNLYPTLGWALQILGYIHYQWNNLEIAQGFYAQVSKYRYHTSVRAQALGFCGLARTLQALGDTEQAHLVSQSTIEWAQEMGNDGVAAEAKAWTYLLDTPDKPVQQTLPWATALERPYAPMVFFDIPQISLAAVLIAQGTPHSLAEARKRLISLREFCATTHNIWHLIEIIALEALMLDALGARKKALAKLEKCLQYARPGGFLRVFVDMGPSMQSLLSELHTIGFETEYTNQILQAFTSPHPTDSSFKGPNKFNDLTNREIEILELLTQSLSNQEIAEHLVISPGTVKQHLYNIYQKLNVNSRLKAVAVAKDRELLPGQ